MNKEEMKKKRNKIYLEMFMSFFMCVIEVILTILFIMNSDKMYFSLALLGIIMLVGILLAVFFMCTMINIEKYRLEAKKYFVLSALDENFTDIKFDPKGSISREKFQKAIGVSWEGVYYSEDHLYGKYKQIPFEQADIRIANVFDCFKGRWITFEFNKRFKCNLIVRQWEMEIATILKPKVSNMKKIKMESEDFNKKFIVYAQNEHEAFYILTPTIIEKIKKLEGQNKGKIILCFEDNKLHIGIDNRENSLEFKTLGRINEEKLKEQLTREIRTTTQFADELELDNDLFKN